MGHLKNPAMTYHCKCPPNNKPDSLEQIDDIEPENSASQISWTSTLLSDILKQFNKELYNQRCEFEKHSLKQNTSTHEHTPLMLISQEAHCQGHISYNKGQDFPSHIRYQNISLL